MHENQTGLNRYRPRLSFDTGIFTRDVEARSIERSDTPTPQGERERVTIDKTPDAARPRLIPQAYTHPRVFSPSGRTLYPPFCRVPLIPQSPPRSTHPLRENPTHTLLRCHDLVFLRRCMSRSLPLSLSRLPSRLGNSLRARGKKPPINERGREGIKNGGRRIPLLPRELWIPRRSIFAAG